MEDAEDAPRLLGQEQFESVGTEVEHGTADGSRRHPIVKADQESVGNRKEGKAPVLF